MIVQMGAVILILLLTVLVIETVLPFIPDRRRGRSGRNVSTRVVLIGLGTGIISLFILILVNTLFPKAVSRQSIALWTLPLAIGLTVGVTILRGLMSRKEHSSVSLESTLHLIIGAYLALAVFRSAPQTVAQAIMIFPAGSGFFSAQIVLIFVDYVLGWMVVALLGTLAFRLLSLSRRRWVMNWTLVVLVLTHLMLIVHILQAQRVIPMSNEAFGVLPWLISHEAVFSIVAVSALLVLAFLVWDEGRPMPLEGVSPAQEHLKRAQARLWKFVADTVADGYLAGALLVTLEVLIDSAEVELSEPESYPIHSESVVINVADISSGHLHRFAYATSSGVEVRFIVIQKAGSSFGIGLDAYEICGASGYYEKDGKIICKFCEVAMNIATIGFRGGYNPIPIEYEVSNGMLNVPLSVLETNVDIFA